MDKVIKRLDRIYKHKHKNDVPSDWNVEVIKKPIKNKKGKVIGNKSQLILTCNVCKEMNVFDLE